MLNKLFEVFMHWFVNVTVVISQSINAVFFFGDPNETVSARAWRNRHTVLGGIVVIALDTLFFFEDDHCLNSHVADLIWAKSLLSDSEG